MGITNTTKFGKLRVGDRFECYGDIHLDYNNYPKICECVKIDTDLAEENDGISFYMDDSDTVLIIN